MKPITGLQVLESEIEKSGFYSVTFRTADGRQQKVRFPPEVAQAVAIALLAKSASLGHQQPVLGIQGYSVQGQEPEALLVDFLPAPDRQLRARLPIRLASELARTILGLPATPDFDLTKTPKH